jgi:nitrate reductase NapAB chaperone NapD
MKVVTCIFQLPEGVEDFKFASVVVPSSPGVKTAIKAALEDLQDTYAIDNPDEFQLICVIHGDVEDKIEFAEDL